MVMSPLFTHREEKPLCLVMVVGWTALNGSLGNSIGDDSDRQKDERALRVRACTLLRVLGVSSVLGSFWCG